MGVVNVTPDSFTDGGRFFDHALAIAHGRQLFADGADIVDVGGESTRPGAAVVSPTEELRRVIPVIEALAPHGRVSIDTRNAVTAEAAVKAGATLLNDVSARLWPVAAATGVGWVAMHMQGDPRTMQRQPRYDDVVADVRGQLVTWAQTAAAAGVSEVWIDPGFGFGKSVAHNVELLSHLAALVDSGWPVCVGLSRKSFLGKLLATASDWVDATDPPSMATLTGTDDTVPVPPSERDSASVAAALWAVRQGASMVRVHDVAATVGRLLHQASGVS